jgi:hemolysin activation/secretion protein
VFGPGKDLGMTDVNIQVTDRKPWQVYAGYANSGTLLTDRNRYYVGASGAPSADVFASYQLTGSGNFWMNDGLFNRPDDAKYVSQAGRVLTPLGLRTSLEVVGDHVVTNERPNNLFRIKTQTSQASAIVRTALSDLLPPAVGDLLGGVELKHQLRTTIFDGTPVAEGSADIAQLVVGWNGRWSDNLGTNTLDVRFKSNPGGILTGNNSLAWSSFTNGRVTDVQTNLVTLEYGRVTPLSKGLSLKSEVSMLASSKPLPDTERIGLGGSHAVRGYVTEDGAVDQALILRNSLYVSMPSMPSWMPGTLAPFLLADVGWGRDLFSRRGSQKAAAVKEAKKQGRRRNIPSTTLPAPDIEIGSRHPVNFRMPGILAGMCEPVHKGGKKLRHGAPSRGKISRRPAAWCSEPIGPSPKIPAMTVLVRRPDRQGPDPRY